MVILELEKQLWQGYCQKYINRWESLKNDNLWRWIELDWLQAMSVRRH